MQPGSVVGLSLRSIVVQEVVSGDGMFDERDLVARAVEGDFVKDRSHESETTRGCVLLVVQHGGFQSCLMVKSDAFILNGKRGGIAIDADCDPKMPL